jgi:hypothetical protein
VSSAIRDSARRFSNGAHTGASSPGNGPRPHPEWGDPTWRPIEAAAKAEDLGVAHLHINDEDVLADPEIALPMHLLLELASEGVVGGAATEPDRQKDSGGA